MAAMGAMLKIYDGSISKSFWTVFGYKCTKFHACTTKCTIVLVVCRTNKENNSKNSEVITITSGVRCCARQEVSDENVRDGHGTRTRLNPASQRRALFYTFDCSELKDEVSLRAKNINQ